MCSLESLILFDPNCWSAFGTFISGLAGLIAIFIAWRQLSKIAEQSKIQSKQLAVLEKQLKDTQIWSKKKSSQEALDKLVLGHFPDLRSKLEFELGCDISDKKLTYGKVIKNIDVEKKQKIDETLIKILNILEVICLNIDSKILDEDICYEYLGWILIEYRRWSNEFIETRRKKANTNKVLELLDKYADRWKSKTSVLKM